MPNQILKAVQSQNKYLGRNIARHLRLRVLARRIFARDRFRYDQFPPLSETPKCQLPRGDAHISGCDSHMLANDARKMTDTSPDTAPLMRCPALAQKEFERSSTKIRRDAKLAACKT
jgi:hypothetical protein